MKHNSASKSVICLILVVTLACMVDPSKACPGTFFSALVQLIPCKAAVSPLSPLPPNDACCSAIKSLGQPCLCRIVNGPPISGVDRNMALQLPSKCTVNFDPCDIQI